MTSKTPEPYCCYVGDNKSTCTNPPTIEINSKTEPYSGTHSCDDHFDDLFGDNDVAHRFDTGEEVFPQKTSREDGDDD